MSEPKVPRYISNVWTPKSGPPLDAGDYVVATKYADGDPGDHFCVGFYSGWYDHFGTKRHLVVNETGQNFRHNGFRRVAKIPKKRGEWIVANLKHVEAMRDRFSVWHWVRAPWAELNSV